MIDRRTFMAAAAALAGCAGLPRIRDNLDSALEEIRATLGTGGRLGLAAWDSGSGRSILFDADSRYSMASTFKLALAGAILAEVDRGALSLDQEVTFSAADLVSHAPVVEANLQRGRISIEQLCASVVEVSDNAAANLLLRKIGGPVGFTAFIRRSGDSVTRLDRFETELNSNLPGDPRDTTSPAAMLGLMRRLLLGNRLSPASRTRLTGWMEGANTGLKRLRAGLPPDWRVGDKTGNGANGAANDLAIAWPPDRAPILISSYQSGGTADRTVRDAAHASIARLIASTLT